MRMVALMNVRSHVVLNAQLSPCRRSEIRLADKFQQQIPDHSILLFDKGVLEYKIDAWEVIATGCPCSQESGQRRSDSLRQKRSPCAHEGVAAGMKAKTGLAALLGGARGQLPGQGKLKQWCPRYPAVTHNAKDVARRFQERWEVELGFRDIKSSMQQLAQREDRFGLPGSPGDNCRPTT